VRERRGTPRARLDFWINSNLHKIKRKTFNLLFKFMLIIVIPSINNITKLNEKIRAIDNDDAVQRLGV